MSDCSTEAFKVPEFAKERGDWHECRVRDWRLARELVWTMAKCGYIYVGECYKCPPFGWIVEYRAETEDAERSLHIYIENNAYLSGRVVFVS